ncbi:MAG: type II toxin-antitoxin system VapC family toxin [Halobaculum sp.]
MDVLDSNLWIRALTAEEYGESVLEDVLANPDRTVWISAYIYREVVRNLDRIERSRSEIDRLQTRFVELVHDSENVRSPSRTEIERLDVREVRSRQSVLALAAGFDVQPKDAPVLSFGYVCSVDSEQTTIRTADESFARFDGGRFYDHLAVEYAGS